MVAIEQGVLIDGVGGTVIDSEVASESVVDATFDGDVLEIGANGSVCQLENRTIAYGFVFVGKWTS